MLEAINLGYGNMLMEEFSTINRNINNPTKGWMAHYDHVTKLAKGYKGMVKMIYR